jgi:hypothetical protein
MIRVANLVGRSAGKPRALAFPFAIIAPPAR